MIAILATGVPLFSSAWVMLAFGEGLGLFIESIGGEGGLKIAAGGPGGSGDGVVDSDEDVGPVSET